MNTIFKFARRCNATGAGMNEGYCCADGEAYFIHESDLLAWLRECDPSYEGMSDDFVMSDAYDGGLYYHTEWPELDEDEWYESAHEDGRDAVLSLGAHVVHSVVELNDSLMDRLWQALYAADELISPDERTAIVNLIDGHRPK